MTSPSTILVPGSERAHYVAQLTLCLLAGLSVAALGWAAWRGAFSGTTRGLPAEPGPGAAASVSAPAPMPAPPAMMPVQGTTPTLLPGRGIANAQVREMVEAAREVRKQGDMQLALESLRAADLREPNHPEILSETALTYEAMGLAEKAEGAWRSVLVLGESGAGGYLALATSKLEGRGARSQMPDRNPVTLGACQVIPDKTITKGQRLALRVPIIAAPGVEIDPVPDGHPRLFFRQGRHGQD